jgi:hypothetical protein
MRIISFIEDQQIVKKILQHLDLWHVKRKLPARANDPPTQAIITFDDSSAPDADAYLIDVDYPIDLSRRSSKNEDGNLPLKKFSCRQSGELFSKCPGIATPAQSIDLDNKTRFSYQVRYWFRLINASICGA